MSLDIKIIVTNGGENKRYRSTPEQIERNVREKEAQRKIDEEVRAKVLQSEGNSGENQNG